ncbi:MAG: CoA-binding protein [Actinomycetia bacterium]|nr:CoA-binding protein [Actinomycetes bacterium]
MRSPEEILREARTIAVVGASPDPARPSYGVIAYLLRAGYRVVPVNPLAGAEVLGLRCVASLAEIGEPVDLVDVFRRPEHCGEVAREAVAAGAGALWLQLGIVSPEARRVAGESGLDYVEDACTAIVHRRL